MENNGLFMELIYMALDKSESALENRNFDSARDFFERAKRLYENTREIDSDIAYRLSYLARGLDFSVLSMRD